MFHLALLQRILAWDLFSLATMPLAITSPAHIRPNAALTCILALQDLGFSLRQITHLLEENLSPEQLRGMLLQKQAELEDHLRSEQERLARANARLQQIETTGKHYDVIIKEVSPQWVASVRDKVSSHSNVGYLFDRLFAYLAPLRVSGLPAVIWHDDSFAEGNIDAEAMIFLSDAVPTGAGVQVYELPAVAMATVVHHGSFQRMTVAYDALIHWLDVSGYRIAGANRVISF